MSICLDYSQLLIAKMQNKNSNKLSISNFDLFERFFLMRCKVLYHVEVIRI